MVSSRNVRLQADHVRPAKAGHYGITSLVGIALVFATACGQAPSTSAPAATTPAPAAEWFTDVAQASGIDFAMYFASPATLRLPSRGSARFPVTPSPFLPWQLAHISR